MNKHEVCSKVLATLSVGLTLVAVPTMAAKPGGGGSTDPCATLGLDFPAFTYRQLSGKDQVISVADASGKCSRVVYKSSSNAGSLGAGAFSYPVSGMSTNNVGRVVWPDGNAIWSIDFTVTGSSIQVGTKRKIYDGFLTSLDLSKDGSTLYVGGYDDVNADRPAIKAVTIATGSTTPIYVGTTAGSFFYSVDAGDAAVLYADLSLPANTGHELMQFTLPCAGSCASVIAANAALVYPAASATGVVAYSDYLAGSNNCWQLRYLDVSGVAPVPVFDGGQPRYGTRSSWYVNQELGDQVLTNGRKSPDGSGRCADTGMVTQVDPATGAETPLVRGYDPDGR